MNEMNEDSEILKLRQIKWKTNLSRDIEKFTEVINDEAVFEKYFSEKYIEKLTNKSKELSRTIIKLSLVYTVLMLSLFASLNINKSEFEIFGYGFKNLGNYKEFLLFLAAVISPISAVLARYKKYIDSLIKECIKKLTPDENIRKFYSHIFIDEYYDGLINTQPSASNSWHGFSLFMMISFGLMLILLTLTLLAGSFFIQIYVIYDVITKPSSSHFINLFVVIFTISSILFSWIVTIMQLPMPEIDNSTYLKLSVLEKEDPEKYQKTMGQLAKENAKKEARSLVILYGIVYTVTFSAIAMQWYPGSFDDLQYFLGKAIPGAFIVMFFTNEILGFIFQKGRAWFFRNYPESSDERLQIFGKMNKIFLIIKILVPFFMSAGYAFYTLSPI